MKEQVNLSAKINGIEILIDKNRRETTEEHPYKSNDSLDPKRVAEALLIGRGISKLVLNKFRAVNEEESGKLHKDLSYNKSVIYEDPSTGPMHGVVIKLDTVNSDEHFGVRFYNATILIHKKAAEPPPNSKIELELTLEELKEARAEKIKEFQHVVKDYKFKENEPPVWLGSEIEASSWFNLTNIISTISDSVSLAIEVLYKGIGYFLHVRYMLYGLVSEVKLGVHKFSQLYDDVQSLLQEPVHLLSFTTEIVKDISQLLFNIIFLELFSPYKNFPDYYSHQLRSIKALWTAAPGWLGGRGDPESHGEDFKLQSSEYLPTQRQIEILYHVLPSYELLNLMVLEGLILYSLTPGVFVFREDMVRTYNAILIRIKTSGLSQETQVKLETKVTNYFNSLPHKSVKIVNVVPPSSLLKVVQDYYGNVDKFYEVAKLNNLRDTELVSGEIEMI